MRTVAIICLLSIIIINNQLYTMDMEENSGFGPINEFSQLKVYIQNRLKEGEKINTGDLADRINHSVVTNYFNGIEFYSPEGKKIQKTTWEYIKENDPALWENTIRYIVGSTISATSGIPMNCPVINVSSLMNAMGVAVSDELDAMKKENTSLVSEIEELKKQQKEDASRGNKHNFFSRLFRGKET